MSASTSSQPKRSDLSLTLIYQACKSPHSQAGLACRGELHSAPVKQLDYTLRKLKSYTKQTQWPARRLMRCLDFITHYGIKPSTQLQQVLQLRSFTACLRWSLSAAELDETCLLCFNKIMCNVLEATSFHLKEREAASGIMADVKRNKVVRKLLESSQHSNLSIRTYSVRALTAEAQCFTKDLLAYGAYDILANSLLVIPSLLDVIYKSRSKSIDAKKKEELEQAILTCRLLETLYKYQEPNTIPKERIEFAESNHFLNLVSLWCRICVKEHDVLEHNTKLAKVKNMQLLIFSLTSIVQSGTSISQKAARMVATDETRAQWQPYLTILLQRWIRGTCCSMSTVVTTPATLNTEKTIMKKFLQISLDAVPVLQHHRFWQDYVDQTICDLTNFFMAYICAPILPEQALTVGKASTLLHTNICVDVEERGFTLTAETLTEHSSLLLLLLESFIQHIQLATSVNTAMVSGRMAWCLKSMLSILVKAEQLDTSSLKTRLLKLVVFFLHYKDAIDMFATSSTAITPTVWGPTIELAKQGLILAASLSPIAELSPQESSTIYKAKRAFVSLEMISKHSRACERLMDCNVLQLVDPHFIPHGNIIEKSSSLFAMYALFGRFVAAMSRRTAYVRTRLREECGLFPMIIKLLQEAIEYRDTTVVRSPALLGWNQVILGCLLVVNSFEYDEVSTGMWLSWYKGVPKDNLMEDGVANEEISKQSVTHKESLSILPCLLSLLFPWRERNDDITSYLKSVEHRPVIIMAAKVLEQLSTHPWCGRQMIMDETALSNLALLLVSLTSAAVCQQSTETQVDQCSLVVPSKRNQEVTIQEDITVTEDDLMSTFVQQNNVEEDTNNTEAEDDTAMMMRCASILKKSAIRILTNHDNIQFNILSDAFTTFFQPLLKHPFEGTSQQYWRREVCQDLYDKKMTDLTVLFQFTTKSIERAIKLHEFAAVAVGYAAIGAPTESTRNSHLGLLQVEKGIVSQGCVFGVLCQMLVCELEYEEEQEADVHQVKKDTIDPMLTLITPFRRNAAAQMIELLTLEWETVWKAETISIREISYIPDPIYLTTPLEVVQFKADDSDQLISASRQLLRARSPIFEAMLGSFYSEENKVAASEAIPLHDVTFHSLNLFISVIHQLNEGSQDGLDSSITSWKDIIDLLLVSDRFGSKVVKHCCEHWVLDRVKHLHVISKKEQMLYLDGLLCLYRHCRDPIDSNGGITSDIWPFATLIRESLKAITQYLSFACQTKEFSLMVQHSDMEELDAFCDGIAYLVHKAT